MKLCPLRCLELKKLGSKRPVQPTSTSSKSKKVSLNIIKKEGRKTKKSDDEIIGQQTVTNTDWN